MTSPTLAEINAELLAACRKVVNNWGNLHHKDLMQLRAAIAKAEGCTNKLPAVQLADDVADKIAREIGLIVAHHIETMYPNAAKAVPWNSCKLSIQGVIRNSVKSAGRAAETGQVDNWIRNERENRRRFNAAREEALK